jgi:hypothetical protein
LGGCVVAKRIFLILFGLFVLGGVLSDFRGHKIKDIAKIEYEDVTKTIFSDGRGGRNAPLVVEDKEKIKEFMSYIDDYSVKEIRVPEPATGWIHSASFYNNEKEIMKITFVNPIIINNRYYRLLKGDLSPEEIDHFLKAVNPSWIIQ